MALRKADVEMRKQPLVEIEQPNIDIEEKIILDEIKEKENAVLDSPEYHEKFETLLKELLGNEFNEAIYNPAIFRGFYMPMIQELLNTDVGKAKLEKLMDGVNDINDSVAQELSLSDQDYFNAKMKEMDIKAIKQDFDDAPKSVKEIQARRVPLYKMDMFTDDEMKRTLDIAKAVAVPMGGFIQNHKQALKKRGWMRPFLIAYDTLHWGRWKYWLDILDKGTLDGSGPIPQIEWSNDHEAIHQVKKMLNICMDGVYNQGVGVEEFADWLLWGLGIGESPPRISTRVNKHWYQNFDLALIIMYPTDYLSDLLAEQSSRGDKKHRGYFPTPMNITFMMTEMAFANGDREKMKYQKVDDPCVGCGAMLLPASNYTLFGYGQDISSVSVKFTKAQMMWYAPWFASNPFDPPR